MRTSQRLQGRLREITSDVGLSILYFQALCAIQRWMMTVMKCCDLCMVGWFLDVSIHEEVKLIVVDNVLVPECLKDSRGGGGEGRRHPGCSRSGDSRLLRKRWKEIPNLLMREDDTPRRVDPSTFFEISMGGDPNLKFWPLKHPSSTGDVSSFHQMRRIYPSFYTCRRWRMVLTIQKLATHQTGAPKN